MAEGRMLKKAISRSRKLAELQTDSARLLYTWLIPHLDVEGRFYGDPTIIRGSIVPRLESYTEKKIIDYLYDMVRVGLINWYQVDGDKYLQFTVFEKHQLLRKDRESQSQIPAPLPDNSGITPGELRGNIIEVKLSKVKLKTPLSETGNQFNQFWSVYPRKQKKEEARKAWLKINPDESLLQTMIKAVQTQKISEQWQKDNGQYIPMPATWLNGKRWEDETNVNQPQPYSPPTGPTIPPGEKLAPPDRVKALVQKIVGKE